VSPCKKEKKTAFAGAGRTDPRFVLARRILKDKKCPTEGDAEKKKSTGDVENPGKTVDILRILPLSVTRSLLFFLVLRVLCGSNPCCWMVALICAENVSVL